MKVGKLRAIGFSEWTAKQVCSATAIASGHGDRGPVLPVEAVERLKPIAAVLRLPIARMSLAWVPRRPEIASAIIAVPRPEQVAENVRAIDAIPPKQALERIDQVVGAVTVWS